MKTRLLKRRDVVVTTVQGLLGTSPPAARLTVQLAWRADDPLSMHARFLGSRGGPNDWLLSRDLLAAALESREPVGDPGADVRAWSSAPHVRCLFVSLTGIEGTNVVTVRREPVESLLAKTFEILPRDEQDAVLARELDGFLAGVLRGA